MERKIIRYGKLNKAMKDTLKMQYPFGYKEHVTEVSKTATSEKMYVVPLELEDKYYLVIVPKPKAKKIKKRKYSNDMSFDSDIDSNHFEDYGYRE